MNLLEPTSECKTGDMLLPHPLVAPLVTPLVTPLFTPTGHTRWSPRWIGTPRCCSKPLKAFYHKVRLRAFTRFSSSYLISNLSRSGMWDPSQQDQTTNRQCQRMSMQWGKCHIESIHNECQIESFDKKLKSLQYIPSTIER